MREVFPKYRELEEAEEPQSGQRRASQVVVSPPMAHHADVVMNPGGSSEVSAHIGSHIPSSNLFEASAEAAAMHSGAGGYGSSHAAGEVVQGSGMLQSQQSLSSPTRTEYLDRSGSVPSVRRPAQSSSRNAPPSKRSRTDGTGSELVSSVMTTGRLGGPSGVMIDAEALNAAVKIVTESIKQVFDSSGSTNPLSNGGRGQSPTSTTAAGQPTSPNVVGSSTSDANMRFQSAVKLLSRMRRDLQWTKEQYKHALAVLRQLDESGVILLLEMDEDAREDFVLSGFE
ncbi:hypothetical protein V1509DRAFT_611311 [Lipomyces kononenkoae]